MLTSKKWLLVTVLALTVLLGTTAFADQLFFDGFESNNFTAGGWVNSGCTIQTTYKYAGTRAAQFNQSDTLTKSLSTAGYTGIVVEYYRRIRNFESPDTFICEWYNGTSWTNLETQTANTASFQLKSFTLPASADNNANFQLRFKTTGCGLLDYAYLDNVAISGTPAAPSGDGIQVDFTDTNAIDTHLYGHGFEGGDPTTQGQDPSDFYSCYGGGIWDPVNQEMYTDPKNWIIGAGTTVSRFPGGMLAQGYDWKNTIGPVANRPQFKFGLDEWLQTCSETDAEPMFTMSYYTGDASDAADLVEYLNMPNDQAYPWAQQRAANGHSDPYGVVLFEFDNETFNNIQYGGLTDPSDYVSEFIAVSQAMKALDDNIKLGAVLWNDRPDHMWNTVVIDGVAGYADFFIEHTYPVSCYYWGVQCPYSADQLFETILSAPEQVDRNYAELNDRILTLAGSQIPLAITEYNTLLLGTDPMMYQHCLGNALYLAEQMRIFMKPENNIKWANPMNFINDWFGLTKTFPDPQGRRPTYYVYSMYKDHFGPTRLTATVDPATCGTYESDGIVGIMQAAGAGTDFEELSGDLTDGLSWTITPMDGVTVTYDSPTSTYTFTFAANVTSQYLNFNMYPSSGVVGNAWYRFSGEMLYDTDQSGIKLYIGDSRGWTEQRGCGASDESDMYAGYWTSRYADWKSVSDTTALQIGILRYGKAESTVCQFRNWQCHKIQPETLPATPYLTVNASKSADGTKVYLMVVNKNQTSSVQSPITIQGFTPTSMQSWVLTGNSVSANNETNMATVVPTAGASGNVSNGFNYTFPKCSVTAIEITGS